MLELRGIARRFGLRWALRGVSLTVSPSEVVAILGRNGSGKTTLLRVAATLLRPTAGHGTVAGYDLVRDAHRVREAIGFFGYSPGLYDDLTATENLVFALRMQGGGVDRSAVARALAHVGLAGEADERPRGFSAGMRRRLALARLTLWQRELYLLDEPYASFDEGGVRLMNEFIVEAKRRGAAVVLATHDIERAAEVADRSVTLEAGRIVSEGDGRLRNAEPVAARVGAG